MHYAEPVFPFIYREYDMRVIGFYTRVGTTDHFIPDPLPPRNPVLHWSQELALLYGEASFHLGQLNALSAELPDPNRFLKSYVIKEALLSSAIEGIHTTMNDVFIQTLEEHKPGKETQLILNYTKALKVSLSMIIDQDLPIANRVILGAHEALMTMCQEDHSNPGNFRKQSVRVGELVPPPPNKVLDLMSEFEGYINREGEFPPLIKTGLAHVQFETIHPFLDGNGRIGRLLIVLMLIKNGLLTIPALYPSYYFKKHHMEYYDRLNRVRTVGDFEGWLLYFLKAIRDSSLDAFQRIKDIQALDNDIQKLIRSTPSLHKMGTAPYQALSILFQNPVINISELSNQLDKSYNTSSKLIQHFIELGLLEESTKQKRDKLYRFQPYLTLLERD